MAPNVSTTVVSSSSASLPLYQLDRGFESHFCNGCNSMSVVFVLSCAGKDFATGRYTAQGQMPTKNIPTPGNREALNCTDLS